MNGLHLIYNGYEESLNCCVCGVDTKICIIISDHIAEQWEVPSPIHLHCAIKYMIDKKINETLKDKK